MQGEHAISIRGKGGKRSTSGSQKKKKEVAQRQSRRSVPTFTIPSHALNPYPPSRRPLSLPRSPTLASQLQPSCR